MRLFIANIILIILALAFIMYFINILTGKSKKEKKTVLSKLKK